MSYLINALFGLLLMASLSLPLVAQTGEQKKDSSEKSPKPSISTERSRTRKALTPTQRRALWQIDQLFDAAKKFEDDGLKIRAQARIADALWDYDETRARSHFEEAFRAIHAVKQRANERDTNVSPHPTPSAEILSDEMKLQLRSEVLDLIARRDSRLTEKLAKSVADTLPAINTDDQMSDSKTEREQALRYLQVAISIAKADPLRAAKLAKLSFNIGGMSNPLFLEVLFAIRSKKVALADELFRDALSAVGLNPAHVSACISLFARYIFPDYGAGGMRASFGSDPDSGPIVQAGPLLIEQFLNFAYQAIMQQTEAGRSQHTPTKGPGVIGSGSSGRGRIDNIQATTDYLTAEQLLPYFDQFMNDKSAAIRAKLNEKLTNITSDAERDLITNLTSPTSVEELLSRAERAQTPLERDSLYIQAALRTAREGDYDQALSIADKISDERSKSFDVKSIIRYEAAVAALKKKDLEVAYRYAKNLPDLEQRARVLSQIIRILLEKKEIVRAMEVLNDAEESISKADNGPDKARAMLIMSGAAARLDLIRGFEVMTAAVKAINQVEFAAQWENTAPTNGSGSSGTAKITFGLNMLNFDQVFPLLARGDFDGALLLAQAIEKQEASVLAQLAVCREALDKPADPQDKDKAKEPAKKEALSGAKQPKSEIKEKDPALPKQSDQKKSPR
jgi:hypothetical protein